MPRPKRQRRLQKPPVGYGFRPLRVNLDEDKGVQLLFEEYESLRLADYESFSQEEAAREMNVSRPTFTRIYDVARRKMAMALVENKILHVAGGHVKFEHEWYRCLSCDTTFRETVHNKGKNCPVCQSTDIEHINGTLHEKNIIPKVQRNAMGQLGYCVCPACGFREKHQVGVPCKSLICRNCQVHFVRENSAEHNNINFIKNQQKNKT
ncbi:MAG: DUF134 domain-containing protein [Bacteroidales bacterium]|nr:DUF134 domain-containing protein [Bacteroidales bacterium]